MWFLLFLLGQQAPECAEPVSAGAFREALGRIGVASTRLSPADFEVALREVQSTTTCLGQVVEPSDAAVVHALHVHLASATGDGAGAARSLLALRSIPGVSADPAWLVLPAGLEPARAAPWVEVVVPPQTALFVDGVPAVARPVDRPAFYQVVGEAARPRWSGWLRGDQDIPEVSLRPPPPPLGDPDAGRALLDEVTSLLADGQYRTVVEKAVPASAAHPDLAPAFRAAAEVAVDQLNREGAAASWAALEAPIILQAPPRGRRGAERRGDDRKGVLLGMELGLPTGLRGEWKIGGSAVDGIGVRVGGGVLFGSGTGYTGTDMTTYADFNLTRRFQLELVVGVFITRSGSTYGQAGGALQWDPPSPLQINLGARLGGSGYLAPDVSVGFLW